MLRNLINLAWIGCLALSLHTASAFSLLGPNNEPWQTPDIGYNPLPFDALPTAPKNLGEEYRRNVPVMYYSFDANFLEYFGSNGVYAVEQAMAILNSLTNVSSYSQNLTEFPQAATRENPTASALSLMDLKSTTLHLMVEQLGLAEPERYTWTLHDRVVGPGGCPADVQYLVVQRNFGITTSPLDQYQGSSYVNGALYSYYILELCASPPGPPLAEAVEVSVDPLDSTYTAVAGSSSSSFGLGNNSGLTPGKFFISLTRDDVAGLRYLLREKNMNWESPGPTSLSLITNTQPQLLFSSNLTLLASQALTNDAVTLAGLYPGLIVTSSTNWFETIYVTNVFPYFTNSPYAPAYTAPQLVFTTTRSLQIVQKYKHTFDNLRVVVYTNGNWTALPVSDLYAFMGHGVQTLEQVSALAVNSPYSPAYGFAVTTNVTSRSYSTNQVVGEYLILSSNFCDVVLIAPQLTFVNQYTNLLVSTNITVTVSNAAGATNLNESYTASIIDYSTNHAFAALPILCLSSNIALTGGIEKMSFVRRDFDSLLGRFFEPITNNYTLMTMTNSTLRPMRVIRPVTQPDFLFTAVDAPLTPGPAAPGFSIYSRNVNFGTNGLGQYYTGLAGPGTIDPSTVITFNKGAPIWFNYSGLGAYNPNTAEANSILFWYWGSYDGSTNAPVVYPNGTSLANVEGLATMDVSPKSIPDGVLNQAYGPVTFAATGGAPPYTWSVAPGNQLPVGLNFSSNGTLSGTPLYPSTYGFVLRMTDAGGRVVDWPYSLTVKRF